MLNRNLFPTLLRNTASSTSSHVQVAYVLCQQHEKQRAIWAYEILFFDVLFPMDLDKVIFVDVDQIV